MDINNINPSVNNLQNLNTNISLDKTSVNNKIENKEEDSYNLSISHLLTHDRTNLAIGLEESNNALAITKITLNTLNNQSNILNKIEDKFNKEENTLLKHEDVQEIKSLLNDFTNNTQNTKFENKNLFKADYEESSIYLSIQNDSIEIEKADLNTISSNLIKSANKLPENEEEFKNVLRESKELLNDHNNNFQNLESNIENIAKESILNESKLRSENSSFKEINFANEVKDFSKTNINANIGLVISQANIVQEQSVKLLSK